MRVLNPRPAAQAAELTQALKAAGYEVLELPLLDIQPRSVDAAGKALLMDLDRFHGVVFVSANAARAGLEALADYWPQWPLGVYAVAVGPSTAQVLRRAGLSPLVPAQYDSEGMLALPELQRVKDQRWLIIRGAQGRDLLRETLTIRGARVEVLPLYDVCLPHTAGAHWQASEPPDVVLLTSAQVWHHWQQIAGRTALQPALLTVSQRLAERLTALGAQRVYCAGAADTDAWLRALAQLP